MSKDHPSTIERAFELARSGRCMSFEDIIGVLKAERAEAVEQHLAGPMIRVQLRTLCRASRAADLSE